MAKPKKQKPPKPPKEPEPWDVLPILSNGDPFPDKLFSEVGKALSAWEALDATQANVFSILVSSRAGAAEAAYGSIVSPASRAEMVLAAARRVLVKDDPLLPELETLIDRVGKLSGRRNDIAHGMVGQYRPLTDDKTSLGYFLAPAFGNTRKNLSMDRVVEMVNLNHLIPMQRLHKYAYTAEQVAWYTAHFQHHTWLMAKLGLRIDAACKKRFPPRARRLGQDAEQ